MSRSSTSNSEPVNPDQAAGPSEQPPTKHALPKAALGATLVVVVINLVAGRLIAQTDWLPSEPRALVTKQVDELRAGDGVWLLGSSTLAQGIDPEQFEDASGADAAVLTLGSAGPVSLTEMALKALDDNPDPPEAVYLFVFKDALNVNRPTIDNDRRYVASLNEPTFAERVTSVAPVYNYRHSIKFNFRIAVAKVIAPGRLRDAEAKDVEDKPMDRPNMTTLMDSGADFEVDLGKLDALAQACNERGVDLYVVVTPTAEAAINWQARYKPDLPYDKLISQLRERGERVGFGLVDFTGMFPSTTIYFRDPYHVRSDHMPALTEAFAQTVREHLDKRAATAD
ncbi:MAG: hypothetical protein ACE37H_10940 [Phycisphaeraceae bacterium]